MKPAGELPDSERVRYSAIECNARSIMKNRHDVNYHGVVPSYRTFNGEKLAIAMVNVKPVCVCFKRMHDEVYSGKIW